MHLHMHMHLHLHLHRSFRRLRAGFRRFAALKRLFLLVFVFVAQGTHWGPIGDQRVRVCGGIGKNRAKSAFYAHKQAKKQGGISNSVLFLSAADET